MTHSLPPHPHLPARCSNLPSTAKGLPLPSANSQGTGSLPERRRPTRISHPPRSKLQKLNSWWVRGQRLPSSIEPPHTWWKLYSRDGKPRVLGFQLTPLENTLPPPLAVCYSDKSGPLPLPPALEKWLGGRHSIRQENSEVLPKGTNFIWNKEPVGALENNREFGGKWLRESW